jgi:TetR/AcrR family transcriptional repressor of nem operon
LKPVSHAIFEGAFMRPREFDHDELLRVAFDQFWKKGVRGTSLSDIARDAGVQRGSLYNAFGSKETLFLRAYERYAGDYLARLTAFFALTIKRFRAGSPARGCPTTRGLMELTPAGSNADNEAARQAFAGLLTRIAALLEAMFENAPKAEFKGDPKAAALHIVTVTRGLAVLERAFNNEAQLKKIAAHAVELVLGRP